MEDNGKILNAILKLTDEVGVLKGQIATHCKNVDRLEIAVRTLTDSTISTTGAVARISGVVSVIVMVFGFLIRYLIGGK